MTCIVGLTHEGKVYVGGDSAGVAGYDLTARADRKVFENGAFLFGFTSSFRMGQLLRYSFNPPKRHPDKDLFAYMATDFVNSVRDCLKSGGYASRSNETESGGTFLVGHLGRLFTVESDYQIVESIAPYAAVGCGKSFALGALYATEGMDPRRRVEIALSAAEANSAGVRGPFYIEVI